MRNKVELLAPAGGERQFISAVENGADAVYVGGSLYNARINAENFDKAQMQSAIDYAHKRGVKVNVTMNTLVADDELAGALDYAGFLYEAGADALIIQDLGLGSVIRKALPDMELHLSTQASICDADSLSVCRDLGYQRVVLARELSLEEIRELCKKKICDIEVFVHGAMCICYSGQCQLSRFYGGRSGNRGQCAQPCRLPYKSYRLIGGAGECGRAGGTKGSVDGRGKYELIGGEIGEYERAGRAGHDIASRACETKGSEVGRGRYELIRDALPYPLSPKDMCQIDNLGELIDAGVCSFKIEGRMKSPEYVAVVTRIYRKYIDEYLAKGKYTVSREDREALLQIFNRGEFTDGYMFGNPGQNLMSERIPKNQGIAVGEVASYNRNTRLANIKTYKGKDIAMHDSIEIYSATGVVASATGEPKGVAVGDAASVATAKATSAVAGEATGATARKPTSAVAGGLVTYRRELGNGDLQLGDFEGRINKGDLVYRTSSRRQLDEARASFEDKNLSDDSDRKPIRKLDVDMKLLCLGSSLTLSVQGGGARASVSAGPFELSEDRKTPLERYRASLCKTGNTPFAIRSLRFEGDFGIIAPASQINALRRQALEELAEKLCIRRSRPAGYADCKKELEKIGKSASGKIKVDCVDREDRADCIKDCADVIGPSLCERARTLGELRKRAEAKAETKTTSGAQAESRAEAKAKAKAKADSEAQAESRAEAKSEAKTTSDDQAEAKSKAKANSETVIAGFELNAYNSKTVEVLKSLGADKVMLSLETVDYENEDEAFPLMISKHEWTADRFVSEKGHDLRVIRGEARDGARAETEDMTRVEGESRAETRDEEATACRLVATEKCKKR